MSNVKNGLGYSEEHEWAEAVGEIIRIGITDYAQCQLGDIVFVEFPEVGTVLEAGQSMGTIESVKTVSDLFCPVEGTVVSVNEELLDHPERVNADPYGEGWLVELEVSTDAAELISGLLDADRYSAYIASK